MDKKGNGKDRHENNPLPAWIGNVNVSTDLAFKMIDDVLRHLGLDPAQAAVKGGWRRLVIDNTEEFIGIFDGKDGEHYLTTFAPIIDLPQDIELADFYKLLLEFNQEDTLSARFATHNNTVYVNLVRSLRGLDVNEIEAAIYAVLMVAQRAADMLANLINQIAEAQPLPLPRLPMIKMTPLEAQSMSLLLGTCDQHTLDIFTYLTEQWDRAGFGIEPRLGSIGLNIPFGPRHYTLAIMRPGMAGSPPLVIIGWESLRKQGGFPPQAIDRYQNSLQKIVSLKITQSSAHILVTDKFDRKTAGKLLQALKELASSIRPEEITFNPTNPHATSTCLDGTLNRCSDQAAQIFNLMIDGWRAVEGTVQCIRPGRIYLKLKTSGHPDGRTHTFNLAVLAVSMEKKQASIEVAWNTATGSFAYLGATPDAVSRFEALAASLPGFHRKGTVSRLTIDDKFTIEHARQLLEAMQALKKAVQTFKA